MNGTATSLRVLREIGSSLVDVNGHHAALSIRLVALQLALSLACCLAVKLYETLVARGG